MGLVPFPKRKSAAFYCPFAVSNAMLDAYETMLRSQSWVDRHVAWADLFSDRSVKLLTDALKQRSGPHELIVGEFTGQAPPKKAPIKLRSSSIVRRPENRQPEPGQGTITEFGICSRPRPC